MAPCGIPCILGSTPGMPWLAWCGAPASLAGGPGPGILGCCCAAAGCPGWAIRELGGMPAYCGPAAPGMR